MAFCGDNGSAYLNGNSYWNAVQVVIDVVKNNSNVKGAPILTTGNHEYQNGSYSPSSTNATQKALIMTGEAAKQMIILSMH